MHVIPLYPSGEFPTAHCVPTCKEKKMHRLMIDLWLIGFLVGILVVPVKAGSEEAQRLSQQIDVKTKGYSNRDAFPSPPISIILRMSTPDLVEKVETLYFTALDYQFFCLRSLRFAKELFDEGKIAQSGKYIERADRFYKLATSLQRGSFAVLDGTYSAAEWIVVYKASRTALDFTVARGLGVKASTLLDLGTLYSDYSLDKATTSLEEAKRNLIAKAIAQTLLQTTGTSEAVGDIVKQGWGSSQAFPVLQKIVGSSEFKDAALREFARLGGSVGDYVAKKAVEEVSERIVKGALEAGVEENADKKSPAKDVREPVSDNPSPEDKTKSTARPLNNGAIFNNNLSVSIAEIQRSSTTAKVWVAFRKISQSWKSGRAFRLRIIDNRENQYETFFYLENGFCLNAPADLADLPCGFTWVMPIEISTPEIVPIARIVLIQDAGTRPDEAMFDLDFKQPQFPDVNFEVKPEQLLSPGDNVVIDKDISFQVGNFLLQDSFQWGQAQEKGFAITLPLTVKNSDYNTHNMPGLTLRVLLEDGRFIAPTGIGIGGGGAILASSTEILNLKAVVGFKAHMGNRMSLPHMLLMYRCSPTMGCRFYYFIQIPSELKQRCREIKDSFLVSQDAKSEKANQRSSSLPPPQQNNQDKQKEVKEQIRKTAETLLNQLLKK